MRPALGSSYPNIIKPLNKNNKDLNYEQSPVEVFCRVRPLQNQNDVSCIIIESQKQLSLIPFENSRHKFKYLYDFKSIFSEDTGQAEIFKQIAVPLLKDLINGKNGLLFSYGITCSGKTYTMFGDYNKPGIIPRCINTLFNTVNDNQTDKFVIKSDKMNGFEIQSEQDALNDRLLEAKVKKQTTKKSKEFIENCIKLDENLNDYIFTVFITFIEIYNNIVYDLLEENNTGVNFQSRILREDFNKNMYVNNVNEIEVKSAKEAIDYYFIGNKRKKMAQTALNNKSSRSHLIFTIRLIIQDKISSDQYKISQLSLVDLAGSERSNRTNSSGLRLKEASCINNSLMSLRQCLEILRDNDQKRTVRIIPYRDSRLTHLFKNYFEGHGNIKMIICVNPSIKDYEENLHVLNFAEMTKEIRIKSEIKLPDSPEINVDLKHCDQEIENILNATTCTSLTSMNPENINIKSVIFNLKRRKEKFSKLEKIRTNSVHFRNRLFELQKYKDNLQNQINYLLPAEKQNVQTMKEKLNVMKLKYDQIVQETHEKENIIIELNKCLEEKHLKLNQSMLEKRKQQQRLDDISKKLLNELDVKMKHQREYLEAQMKEKSDKLELVKNIVTDRYVSNTNIQKLNPPNTTINDNINEELIIPKLTSTQLYPKINISHRNTLVSNIRYNRSSSSSKWLEHKSVMPVPLGTVLQPKMNRKKSVSGLISKGDIVNFKRNKYVLISQNKDGEGDLETKLYKGDIIPTCSGGAQVILNDVEKLKQESPLNDN